MKIIKEISEFDELKTFESFKYKCIGENCDKSNVDDEGYVVINSFRKERIDRYKTFLCRNCFNVLKFGSTSPFGNKDISSKTKQTKLEKYGDENYNNREKAAQTNIERYGAAHPMQSDIVKEKAKETNIQRYGVSCTLSIDEIKEQSKQTKLEKYGDENYNNREKCKETMMNKYGSDWYVQTDEFKEQSKQTKLEKYGDENYNNREKAAQTNIERYDVSNPYTYGSDAFKSMMLDRYGDENYNNLDKIKSTNTERYGVEMPRQNSDINAKAITTCIERYGFSTPAKNSVIKEKAKATMLDKYGTLHISHRYQYFDGEKFDSAWELALWIYAKDHNEEIVREPIVLEYEFDGEKHHVTPDFMYKGELIEIKGNQYFLNQDPTKRMIFPYNRLHSDSPELTPEEKQYMDDLYEAKHQCETSNGVRFWCECEMKPYLDYIDMRYGLDYLNKFDVAFALNNFIDFTSYLYFGGNRFVNMNGSCCYTPYNSDIGKEYQDPIGVGLTPFDVK